MNRLHKNFALLTATGLLSPVFSMVLVLAISRLQGVEMLGKYSLMMTVFVLGQNCAALGLPVVITREVAQAHHDAARYFTAACLVTLTLVVVAIAAVSGGLQWAMADDELRLALELVLLALVPTVITAYSEAVLLAFERAADFVALNLVENTLRALIGTGVVFLGGGIISLAWAVLGLRLLTAAAYVLALRRRGVELSLRLDARLCRSLLRDVPVLGSIPVVNAVYARADIFLLTWFGTWTDVGLYSAGLRLVDVTRSIPPAYARALYPILSRLRASAPEEFAAVSRRSIRNILMLVVPIALMLSGLAQPVVTMLYGPQLAEGATSLRVLAWALVPMALATTLAQMLFAADKQAVDLRVNLIATVVSVATGMVTVPLWGAVGAAIAVLISSSVYAALQYRFVCEMVTDVAATRPMATLSTVAAISALIMLLAAGAHPILTAAIGLAVYAAGLTVSGLITRSDLDRMRLSLGGLSTAFR